MAGAALTCLVACNRATPEEKAGGAPSAVRAAPPAAAAGSAPVAPGTLAAPIASAAPGDSTRGGELYGRMCAVCHGAHGEGYRADGAPALAQPDFLASVSDEFLDFAIAVGRRGTPMSAWRTDQGGPLSAADVA